MFNIGMIAYFRHIRLVSDCIVPRYGNRTQLLWFRTRFGSRYLISALVRKAICKVQNNFHYQSERRTISKYIEIIHETKNVTPLVNGSAATCGTAGNMNASVEIIGFDFSGTAQYRTVSERCKYTSSYTNSLPAGRCNKHRET
jgi:hypothetical protein